MIYRILTPLLFCCISFNIVLAQGIRGRITNVQGEAIAFANIYIPQLKTGTTSNIDGNYELKLPEGNYKVLFQYLGYQTQSQELTIAKAFQKIDIQLISQTYTMPEITILASGEDHAYYIMRHAIALAPYYQKQVSKYSCKVYLKGSGIFEKIPFLFEKQMKKGGMKENEPFVMETVSKIDFELPDKINQQVLAMRSSGKDNNTSPMGMITNNLYDAEKYGVVSPVGKNALKVYNFSLEGSFEDQGRTINKIKVTPKSNGKDVFSGYIYIADGFWNIHSADLKLHMPMTNVNVHQVYAEVNKNTWMPVSLDFDMDFAGLGLKMKFKYVASITDYKTTLNPSLDHTFLDKQNSQQLHEKQLLENVVAENNAAQQIIANKTKTQAQKQIDDLIKKEELTNRETLKLNRMIESETRRSSPPEPLEIKSTFKVSQKQVNNDSAYWTSLRPIPLTETEKSCFIKKDSFLRVSVKPEYKDSLRNSKRKFKIKHLLLGKTYDYSVDSIKKYEQFSIPSLLNPTSLTFNSVDGVRMDMPFSYYKSDSIGHYMRISPFFAYGFASKKLDASLSYQLRLNSLKNSWFSVGAGTTTVDYNRGSGLSSMTNAFYTLFLEENYKRFYRRDFLQLTTSRDLVNGLSLNLTVDYSENSPLSNHSTFTFFDDKNKEIQPNVPLNNTMSAWQLENHQTLAGQVVLSYTPHLRYSIRNNTKMYAGSKYPTYTLSYKGAFSGLFGNDSRYDLIKLGMRQNIKFGIDDHLTYSVNAGTFLNSSKVYFEDFQHFNTQSTTYAFNSAANSFRLLPFYEFSTQKSFLEAHLNWQTRRLILKQLPIIRNSSFSENLFVNYLSTPEIKNYTETGYGLSNVLMMLNVEAVAGFGNGKFRSAGIRVSMNIR
ncbi:MAG: DUF5686 and carboxypeptidase regulatory-like domain-containing protein [Bacteroidia bacterium]|nr:DUF5686 and carboxypeptidase regulatory-like domain-containing protein [Bacteroidia bacterium]